MHATDPVLDDVTLAALGRLTEREKDCLRRWLRHQTAKKIAIDLGVTPHAVEKRLKMARAKLGTANSLEAARLLAAHEQYDWTGPHLPDLGKPTSAPQKRRITIAISGLLLMSIAAAAIFTLLSISSGIDNKASMSPKPGEIVLINATPFEKLDVDRSGYLEGDEAPVLVKVGGNPTYAPKRNNEAEVSGEYIEISAGNYRDQFYSEADTDADGRVSRAEYSTWAKPKQPTKRAGSD